jgi:transposase
MRDEETIRRQFELLAPHVDERARRLMAAAEAQAIGFGGVSLVARATGMSRETIRRGIEELKSPAGSHAGGVRRPGGGRKKTVDCDPTLKQDLEKLVNPAERGDPESALRWTSKSVRRLAEELKRMGHQTSHRMVAEILHDLGYSLQANRKTLEGSSHPDRDAQFEHINHQAQEYFATSDPVISVDTKKKELVGDFKNGGREWHPKVSSRNNLGMFDFLSREDCIVPFTVKTGTMEIDLRHFVIAHLPACRIRCGVELCPYLQTSRSGGRCDELHNDLVADQGLAPPVLADEGEESMFDLVPFARAGRKVAHGDRNPQLIGQLLKLHFPQPDPGSIAPTAIGCNQ